MLARYHFQQTGSSFLTTTIDSEIDAGHFIAHSLGGGLDMNIFPQKRSLNQGRSEEGKVYREMERYPLLNPSTFLFIRPIYFDYSERPYFLEYGVLRSDAVFWTICSTTYSTTKMFAID